MPSVVFINSGAEPQSPVGSIQDLRTDYMYSKMKKSWKREFLIDETGGDFSKRVENTVEKGEIAPKGQISFSHNVFKYLNCRNVKTRACLGFFFHVCERYS